MADESSEDEDDNNKFGSKEDESEHESKDEEGRLSESNSESERQPSREGSDNEEDLGLGQDNILDDTMVCHNWMMNASDIWAGLQRWAVECQEVSEKWH